MVLVQQHSRALLFRQRLNGAADDCGAVAGHQLLFDTGPPVGQLYGRLLRISGLAGLGWLVQRDLHPAIAAIAQGVQRQVGGDAEKPRGELGAGRVLLPRAVDAQENFLRQILRFRRVAHHAVQEADQWCPILAE